MAAGDIKYEYAFFLLPVSKNATAAITKGQVVDLSGGDPAVAADLGPFGVAIADIASGEDMKGKVLIKGAVDVVADGAIGQFEKVKVSGTTAGRVVVTVAPDAPASYVEADMQTELDKLHQKDIGLTLDAASAAGDVITILID